MDFEQGLEVANVAVYARFQRRLTDIEVIILRGAWQGQTYEEIAELAGYSVSYLKQGVGPKVWKLLSQALGETVSKTNFREPLERYRRREDPQKDRNIKTNEARTDQESETRALRRAGDEEPGHTSLEISRSPPLQALPTSANIPRTDWGEALDVSTFFGRTVELATLQQWIEGRSSTGGRSQCCRLVALLGMGGIGKTALSVKVAQTLQNEFDCVIWRSLRNAPRLEALLGDLVSFVSNQQDTQASLSRLLHWLRNFRCLVVLDNGETLLQAGDRAGRYRPGYEDYGELFQRVGESQHQSCLILTSREKPVEIATLEGIDLSVRSLLLGGSAEAAEALIRAKGLVGSEQQQQQLCQLYSCNPLALKIVATSIQDVFAGEIAPFLEQNTIIFNSIRRLLAQQFDRLSPLEQTIMYWLAINREWTTIADLAEDIVPSVARTELLEALESLSWRSLIETQAGRYSQQPVVMEYVTDRLIREIGAELTATGRTPAEINQFVRYALIKATAKNYIRESQIQLILEPVAAQLYTTFSSKVAIEQQLQAILHQLHQQENPISGYGAGNLINLCAHLQIELTGYDFSCLTVRQAYLQNLNLRRVNFAHAAFIQSVFTQTFGNILAVAFHPDGTLLATGDANNQVYFWQIASGEPLLTCQGHTDWVRSVLFSPEGQILISGSDDQTIRFWDVHQGQCLKVLAEHPSRFASIDYSPVESSLPSGRGRILASSSEDGTVRLWDSRTGVTYQALQGHTRQVWAVAFSPDGRTVVSGSEDQTVRFWDVHTHQCLKVLEGHTNWVQSVAFSPDGRLVASGSHDRTAKLWDVATGECVRTLVGHNHWIWSVAFNPQGNVLATAGEDLVIRLWEVDSGRCLKVLAGHTNRIWAIAFSPDGQTLASGSDDQTLKLWDVNRGQCLKTLQGHTRKIFPVVYSPDGQILASSGDEPLIRLWDARTGQCLHTLGEHSSRIESIAFSPDGQTLVSGGEDRMVRLWDVQTGQCLHALQGHTKQVWTVAFSPDGQRIASSGEDGTIWLWDPGTGHCIQVLEGHPNWVLTITFSPDGRYLASASFDQTVKLWDAAGGQLLNTFEEHRNSVLGVAFSPDSRWLASGSFDRCVKLWDVETGACVNTFEGHTDSIIPVSFSPSGQMIASGSLDNTIKLWDCNTGQCLNTLEGHTELIYSLSFNPVGGILASGSWDETIKLWDVESGHCLQTLRTERPYEGMNITAITGISEAQKATLKTLGAIELTQLAANGR
ncbi:hypothetical protein J5X98_00835 [Leptothermofonsia sichuanensis E412]|uniref:WD40 repeat domain-containing protein n=1 Tax=Leptothermofonsia sichuanensis TaxID=2917832 RepID=UPI001CA78BEE|nr:NB-ARC domain-containing protein [Leptothermofonsia sichuanensis]QZZ21092.1 hypothetical protein J5X98_00835 [Leptothermofonsia sichuanensis E412]